MKAFWSDTNFPFQCYSFIHHVCYNENVLRGWCQNLECKKRNMQCDNIQGFFTLHPPSRLLRTFHLYCKPLKIKEKRRKEEMRGERAGKRGNI